MDKMKTKHYYNSQAAIFSLTLAITALFVVSCSEDKDGQSAHLQVRMTDAPADYQEVIVDVQDVQVNSTSDEDKGWISLDVNKGQYDLLELTNGLDTLLGTAEIPAGHISQIRLVLGTNNSIKVGGVVQALTTPSAQQSGLKVNVNTDFEAGKTYTILLDFDAAR